MLILMTTLKWGLCVCDTTLWRIILWSVAFFSPAYNFDSMSPGKNCEAVELDQDYLLSSLEIVCNIRGICPCLHSIAGSDSLDARILCIKQFDQHLVQCLVVQIPSLHSVVTWNKHKTNVNTYTVRTSTWLEYGKLSKYIHTWGFWNTEVLHNHKTANIDFYTTGHHFTALGAMYRL